MTDQSALDALQTCIAQFEIVINAVEYGGDIPTEAQVGINAANRALAALAASATDEGPGGLTALEQREIAEVLAAADKMPLLNRFFATLAASATDEPWTDPKG